MEYVYIPVFIIVVIAAYTMMVGYIVGFFIGSYIQRQKDIEALSRGESIDYKER